MAVQPLEVMLATAGANIVLGAVLSARDHRDKTDGLVEMADDLKRVRASLYGQNRRWNLGDEDTPPPPPVEAAPAPRPTQVRAAAEPQRPLFPDRHPRAHRALVRTVGTRYLDRQVLAYEARRSP